MARQYELTLDGQAFIGEVLKVAESRGYIPRRLCEETGVSDGTVTRLKRGSRKGISGPALAMLSLWSGVDPTKYVRINGESAEHLRGTR
jgi:transcriptional regulator with XRE-family HTH domain